MLRTHPRPLSYSSTTVLAGLIRPFMIQVAPRRSDLKKLVPYLQVVKCSRGDILFHDNHQRPKKTERYWYVVCSGECSVQTWDIEDIIRKRHEDRVASRKRGSVVVVNGGGGGCWVVALVVALVLLIDVVVWNLKEIKWEPTCSYVFQKSNM